MVREIWCSLFFFCKQKTAYEMRISDWSSDVCSSDLDAECSDLEAGGLGSVDRLAGDRQGGRPDLLGVVLDPAARRVDLPELALRDGDDRAVGAKGAGPAAGCYLVYRHARLCLPVRHDVLRKIDRPHPTPPEGRRRSTP